jgi:hypothetical protein
LNPRFYKERSTPYGGSSETPSDKLSTQVSGGREKSNGNQAIANRIKVKLIPLMALRGVIIRNNDKGMN